MAGAGAAPTRAGDAAIQRLINDAEKKSRDQVDAITRRLNVVCELSREYVDRITSVQTDIGDEAKKGSDNNLIPLLKEAETLIAECKTSASGISHKCNVKSCVFVGNTTLSDHLQSVGAIGELVPETFPCRGDDINVRGPTDDGTCNVAGLLALADDRLLLSDFNNRKIKLFDVNHKLVSHVKVKSRPYDIAEIDGGQMAVCLSHKKIQLVLVSGILTLGRRIKTAVDCSSVTRCGDNLAAVGEGPDIVEIDMRGRKVTTVWTCPDGNLNYINHNTRGELLTIGYGDGCAVTRVTRDGVVLARYQGDSLMHPNGLTVHPDGSIYVCRGFLPGNIEHITADCTRSIEVFGDGHKWPKTICYNQHHNSLYVSQNYEDCIKVFRLGY